MIRGGAADGLRKSREAALRAAERNGGRFVATRVACIPLRELPQFLRKRRLAATVAAWHFEPGRAAAVGSLQLISPRGGVVFIADVLKDCKK